MQEKKGDGGGLGDSGIRERERGSLACSGSAKHAVGVGLHHPLGDLGGSHWCVEAEGDDEQKEWESSDKVPVTVVFTM